MSVDPQAVSRNPHLLGPLADAFEAAPLPLWIIGAGRQVLRANEAAALFLGFRRAHDLTGGPSHDLLHSRRPDGSPYPAEDCGIVCARGPASADDWFVTQAGDPRLVTWTVRPLPSRRHVLLSFTPAPEGSAGSAPRAPAARSVIEIIQANFVDPHFDVAELADRMRMSVRNLEVVCSRIGFSPAAEIRRVRLVRAQSLLERGETVGGAAFSSGFADVGTFSRAFRREYGVAPSMVRPRTVSEQVG